MFPESDEEFWEESIAKVDPDGRTFECDSRWSFSVPDASELLPKPGMIARFYGKGIGFPTRGLFLNGEQVFYRTEAEQKDWHETCLYGVNAEDWLKRWDEGRSVWTIEMGGLGPGYEQAIQIAMAEVLRFLLEKQYDPEAWTEEKVWKHDLEEIRQVLSVPTVAKLGLSGAQWGAALNLAIHFYRQGPRKVMTDEQVKDRHIQVSKHFPGGSDALDSN